MTAEIKFLEVQPPGLAWVQRIFNLEPQWTVEPDPQVIKQTVQSLLPSSTVQVTFLGQGALNKIYDVKIDNEIFVMRVSLPVDPYYKTMSEVSTLDWISRTTNIPVPRVITYQSSRDNPIGFEWIIMTKMPGRPLKELWRSLSFSVKTSLVGELAAYSSCLFRNQLHGIGNLYRTASILKDSGLSEATWLAPIPAYSDTSPLSETKHMPAGLPDVGRIVSMHFFWGSHILQDVHRGPFTSSNDWIASRLSLSEKDCQSTLDNLPSSGLDSDDEADADDARRTLEIIGKLKALLPSIFPPSGDNPEPSVLVHDDLSSGNILVHDNGELAAILDWECVSALPLWNACYYPAFLQGRPRRLEPDLGRYKLEANGEACDLYWEHLWDYEFTLLRDVFIDRMKSLEPEWVEIFHKSQRQRDFDLAVQNCDNEFVARHIRAWINDLTAGVDIYRSLHDRIYGD
ncbi:Phosphotransferase enzyme family protein [Aspergillus parasiticus SU-1]|uniref:Phosphotransferase enzyme family protein n=1 Tax=Aspergillus parasiticus (strain ATCC 56775 / NRRL 5862 / SRRC 143 / SU-1) TaxID=1403190 RepID=A0A0F0INE8_ASPPU|nr:Phosphotransferase enzyme family protein [Aspergillus parasiticus SU-1]